MVLGIDIGGSGIKGAPVDVARGSLLAKRYRVETPKRSRPDDVVERVRELVVRFEWTGPIGCAFPAVIEHGVAQTAINVAGAWLGERVDERLSAVTGCPVTVLNDADAAGIAELRFGAGVGCDGVVVVLTLGTGIGSALFFNGELIPNTELAHLEIDGAAAEELAAGRLLKRQGRRWKTWADGLNSVLERVEMLVRPRLIIIGGGVSKHHARFLPRLRTRAEVRAAELRNDAGIVGAAVVAHHHRPYGQAAARSG